MRGIPWSVSAFGILLPSLPRPRYWTCRLPLTTKGTERRFHNNESNDSNAREGVPPLPLCLHVPCFAPW